MRLIAAAGACLLLAACATTGQTANSQSAALANSGDNGAASGDVADADKVRCKYMPVTGSRRGHRICHTEREWKAMEDAARETMRDIESQGRGLDFDG